MNVGFTGTKQGMTPDQRVTVTQLLMKMFIGTQDKLDGYRSFHHGDCRGADVQAAEIAKRIGYWIVCHPPIKNLTRGYFSHNDTVMPRLEYIERDRAIVNDTNTLIACPHTGYEIVRSGTWTTVRYARQQRRLIYIIQPDGQIVTEWGL